MSRLERYKAKVSRISANEVEVSLIQYSACQGCHAASTCTSAECRERKIKVCMKDADRKYKIGQEVNLIGSSGMSWLSILLAFGLPLLIVIICLVSLNAIHASEVIMSLSLVISLVLYYLLLFALKKPLKKRLAFRIETIEK